MEKLLEGTGYSSFRPGQKEVIEKVLNGENVFAMLPTGSGKTLCYYLPSKVMEGLVVVVSPLVSLMNDQLTQLRAQGEKRAAQLSSLQSHAERVEVIRKFNQWRLLYLSPEMLSSDFVQKHLKRRRISLFVVDEAHCISQWGHEFRPDYQDLGLHIRNFQSPPVLALTATATEKVKQDILTQLDMKNAHIVEHSIDRPNIYLEVKQADSRIDKLSILLDEISRIPKPCIIYTGTRAEAAVLAERINSPQVAAYHGGLTAEERNLIQTQFINDELQILTATNAFGMGINKPDVRAVIHMQMPASMEHYVQEIGRAGRDGVQSKALLLFAEEDMHLPLGFIESEFPAEGWLEKNLLNQESDGKKLEEIRMWTDVSDTLWRMVTAHLKKEGLIRENRIFLDGREKEVCRNLEERYENRRREKYRQLAAMRQYVDSSRCLREELLSFFNEELQNKPAACCSNCGSLTWPEEEKSGQELSSFSWQERLEKIFFTENRGRTYEKAGRNHPGPFE